MLFPYIFSQKLEIANYTPTGNSGKTALLCHVYRPAYTWPTSIDRFRRKAEIDLCLGYEIQCHAHLYITSYHLYKYLTMFAINYLLERVACETYFCMGAQELMKSGGRGSRVVNVSDRGWPCYEFEPSTTKDPPSDARYICRELKRPPVGVVW
ncbi:hypothetical protein TNCV_4634701 [Trichonephila clavipes]|nr:hypothetical protein TNCV_4634701 [Trichonephila clavipes]